MAEPEYEAAFAAGHRFSLLDRPDTFRVSQAGLALGNHLVANLRREELAGRVLELGTGSGAIALLLRSLGATSIVAADISAPAVDAARANEAANFGDPLIDFRHSNLFPADDKGPYDLVVFNPPGWRAPSAGLLAELARSHPALGPETMFYAEDVLLKFLRELPEHLAESGRAIVGLNSLIGIADIFARSRPTRGGREGVAVLPRLLERHEFPLLFYTEQWRELRESLLAQFERGREEYAATYTTRGDTIHWYYEITEVTVRELVPDPLLPLISDVDPAPMVG